MIRKLDEYKQKWELESSNSIQLGLDRMRDALKRLGNPHEHLKFIHVTGTNGKGSTIAFLEQFVMKHNLTVGKFTSPCIVDVHDQLQINGKPILSKELDEIFSIMKQKGLSGFLTDFELLTCAAFLYFYYNKVDIVLLEVGMGGREDSTNVITPLVSIITNIDIEHTNFLGKTLESIAYHKAGIIKEHKPVIIGKLPKEAHEIVIREANDKKSKLYELDKDFFISNDEHGEEYIFKPDNIRIGNIKRSLLGDHQSNNMALALTAFLKVAEHLNIKVSKEKILNATKVAFIPGRFEEVLTNVYFDGAHNPASAKQLANTIRKIFPKEKIRFIIGMVNDKDSKKVLEYLETVSDEFYFVDFENNRALAAKSLQALSNATKKEIITNIVPFIKSCSRLEGITIVTGSLYLLAEIRNQLLIS